MNKLSEHIRECACGEAPAETERRAATWIGNAHQWKALDRLRLFNESFYKAGEMQQRTFLLLVAADLESAKEPA